jgi:hypothetical protein
MIQADMSMDGEGPPGLSGPDDTLVGLVNVVEPLQADAPTQRAYEAFSADPALYALAIVDEAGCPIGIINRFKFLEALSRPFGPGPSDAAFGGCRHGCRASRRR